MKEENFILSEGEVKELAQELASHMVRDRNTNELRRPLPEEKEALEDIFYSVLYIVSEKIPHYIAFFNNQYDEYFNGAKDVAEMSAHRQTPNINAWESVCLPLENTYDKMKIALTECITSCKTDFRKRLVEKIALARGLCGIGYE